MTNTRYSPELRERAVKMVLDRREDYKSEWAAVTAISQLFGMSPETLRTWLRRTQIDDGPRPGLTSGERALMKQPQPEVKDLRRQRRPHVPSLERRSTRRGTPRRYTKSRTNQAFVRSVSGQPSRCVAPSQDVIHT